MIENNVLNRISVIVSGMIDCKKCPIYCDWVSDKKCCEHISEYIKERLESGNNEK